MKRFVQQTLLFIALVLFTVIITSCTKQQKAEKAVSEFIEKFSTNPETYESIEFLEVEKSSTEEGIVIYKITHMYRIVGADERKKVLTHTFKLSERFNVFVEPFEQFE